jgi:hypothetical protein
MLDQSKKNKGQGTIDPAYMRALTFLCLFFCLNLYARPISCSLYCGLANKDRAKEKETTLSLSRVID